MAASYDSALTELYQAPHSAFVTERKRLAGALKDAGDKAGAGKLGKLTRPPVSAWAVNQLWWRDRRDFDAMLATAERLREGDLGAGAAHREAIAKLRARAAALLENDGHAASEATLRRVTTTLSAIAAVGGFDPDPPGMLPDDRDPPGFETMVGVAVTPPPAQPQREQAQEEEEEGEADAEEKRRREAEEAKHEAQQRAEEVAARRKQEVEAARKKAERERVAAALRTATGEVERLVRDVEKLRASIEVTEDRLARARAIEADLAVKLEELDQAMAQAEE